MIASTLTFATALLVLVTLTPLSRSSWWWVRDLDFPRLQFCIFSALLLPAQIIYFNFQSGDSTTAFLATVATALCLLYQLVWITPYTIFFPKEVLTAKTDTDAPGFTILVANVLTPNEDVHTLLNFINEHQPDVVLTLETDLRWEADLTPLTKSHPHAIKQPQDNLYGMHVFSKLPILEHSIEFLVEKNVPSMFVTFALSDDQNINLFCVHPAPPSPTENAKSSERDAELVMVGRRAADADLPVIVAGDLNDVAWSQTTRLFRKVSGLLDPRVGRGMFNTFHANHWWLRWPLDHLFCSNDFSLVEIRRLPYFGSDHFALLTHLVVSKEKGAGQNDRGLEKTHLDKKLANEKVNAV